MSLRMRPAALLLVAVLAIGCHAGFRFDARNDSDAAVIVLFGGTSADPDVDGYLVPAGAYGLTAWAMDGAWRGRVRVVDSDCSVLWEGDIDADLGGALIASDGPVTWVTTGTEPKAGQEASAIESTEKCATPVAD